MGILSSLSTRFGFYNIILPTRKMVAREGQLALVAGVVLPDRQPLLVCA